MLAVLGAVDVKDEKRRPRDCEAQPMVEIAASTSAVLTEQG